MECNRCGECCSSLRAPGGRILSRGALPKGPHYGLITLLDERTLKARDWQVGDDHSRAHNAYSEGLPLELPARIVPLRARSDIAS